MAQKKLSRRQFLQIVAVGGIAGLTAKLGLDSLSAENFISETRLLMGTVVNLKVVGSDPSASKAALSACLDKMGSLEAVFSRFQPESQLSILNRRGYLGRPDDAFIDLVRESHRIGGLTQGAFDITIKPLLDLYEQAKKDGRGIPSDVDIQKARSRVNYIGVLTDGEQIRFSEPEMAVTLDGIAKGYIVDQGIAVLKEYGFSNVLVEAGGDLFASGQKTAKSPWQIGISSPRPGQESVFAKLDVVDKALATSGDYMQAFSTDFAYHHIIDPRTGYSAPELASVTVSAPTVMLADALSTSIMVLGSEAGLDLAYQINDVEALVVGKNLEISQTPGFLTTI